MKKIGDDIWVQGRSGHVIGYWTGKRHGHAEHPETYYVVELRRESGGYLETQGNAPMYISMVLIHVSNVPATENKGLRACG